MVLGLTGVGGALALSYVARRFRVDEDPRIDEIEQALPGANCGACGLRGCRDFAVTAAGRGSLDGLRCPGCDAAAMASIASILGVETDSAEPGLAVVRCNGDCDARSDRYLYDGVMTCSVMSAVGVGSHGCSFGCLGCGDCVAACPWDAIRMDPDKGLPVVDAGRCVGCGLCASACPRHLIEVRERGPMVWVACASRDRGAVARKVCANACIGCFKCSKVCASGAARVADNLAYIDASLCVACGECVGACPAGAIHADGLITAKNDTDNE